MLAVGGTPNKEQSELDSVHTNLVFSKMPTMPELRHLEMPDGEAIDIAQRIGTSFEKFGSLLLNDDGGSKVQNIYHDKMKEVVPTNVEILRRWLAGSGKQPVTWGTLIKVLKDTGEHLVLVQQIERLLLHNN